MDCAGCGRANREGARFCGGCGRPLAPRCPKCGTETQPGSQFCDACGASLAAPQSQAAEARKIVTIVFADLIGSTALHERLDAESARRLMDRYHRSMGAVVESHGGTVMQLLGDGVLAGFGVPRVAEDDALRAVRAAVGMQQAFRELVAEQAGLAGDIGLRVAVNTGEVVAGDDHTHVMGDPVNVAARLQQEARDGDVLLGESTQRLVAEKVTLASFGSFALKGRAEPVAAYRVVSLERPAGAPAIAFVGRDDELRRIRAVYDTAVATPAARLAVVLGSPGLGKSRLIDEFTRRLGDGATVLMAHCDAAGGATFAPLAEALRGLLRIDDGTTGDALRGAILSALPEGEPERARIADGVAALVAGTPASPEEIFFVVRRGLAALAAERPVVLAIDDIQWAEPLLHDLIEHLVQWGSDVPLLVLAAARPELRDMRSSLATPGSLVGDVVTLAGLDAGAATKLAANAIGAAELPAAIAGRILATSEGNPLFVGELVRMLVHDGALKREGDRWTAGVALEGLEMPPTIHALLAARIERLRPEERTVLERAAVIGRHFSRTALAQLLPREVVGDLDAKLESLRRSELVEPDTGWFLGEPVLRFHHVLIRDAAYRRLLKNTRAELHGRFADWLEARAGGAVEHDETLGWHLEQAHQHLRELGPVDAQGRALGERAARHLAAAGRRALARDDLPPAASLLERALGLLDQVDPARADLALDWCEALLSAGDVGNAARAIAELARFIDDSDRLRAWHTCFSGQLAVFSDPKALRASAEAVEAAAGALAAARDAAGEAKAHSVHALVLAQLGKIGACEAALDKALAAARRAHDRRRANAVLAGAPVAALWGPSPVTRASGRCLDVVRVLRITQGAPAVEAVALRCQAVLETLRGRAEAARRMIASSRRMVEELGITQRVLEADLFAGLIELLEGDAAAAERSLRVAYEGLRAQGLGIDAAQAAALLGRALLAQGRVAEAESISIESESLAGDSFKSAIAWRGVRAEALAARGEHAAAIEFARAAVEIAAATDDLLDHADARQALAVALRAAGRSAEADGETKRAIELWEAKGATLLVERARRASTRSSEPSRLLAPSAAPAQTALRRVRPNAATAVMARSAAAIEARDAEAVAALHSDTAEYVDHTAGATYGRGGFIASLRSLTKARDLVFRQEPLAILGDSLALGRRFSSASGVASTTFDVGAYEREALNLFEVDEQTRVRRIDVFAPDRLGDAVARLYERYAELLPDGPERTRAAATARSVTGLVGPAEPDRWATALAPAVEFTDHRSVGLLGFGRGVDTVLRGMRTLLEIADHVTNRIDDVLGLRSDAFLVRWANLGTARAGGGVFERQYLQLFAFGSDGLATRMEWFDADRDAEALARFDELRAEPQTKRRRVRPNAATAATERFGAAFVARDAGALAALFADDYDSVEHLVGASVGRDAVLGSLQAILRSSAPTFRYEHLATLGESLAMSRRWWSSEATSGGRFDVAASVREVISVVEVDEDGRFRWGEIFAADHLGDAVARLYERYAELLPDAERARAAATARSVAALPGSPDRWPFAPDAEATDHRTVGFGSLRGADAVVRAIRALIQLSDDWAFRIDDVLDLRSDALLVRWATSGTLRAGGGAFERAGHMLWVFGADGLVARWEQFDVEQAAEALARFDELAAPRTSPTRRVRPNSATANASRLDAAIAAKDADALPGLFADSFAIEDHQTGVAYDQAGSLATWRGMLRIQELRYRQEPLATQGDSLALLRQSSSGVFGGKYDAGAFDREELVLLEVDAQGRRRRAEIFASGRLGDAITRLYERYAELLPEGPARARAAATARSVAAYQGPHDPDRFATAFAPGIDVVDHRILGTWSTHGAEELLQNYRGWLSIADNISMRHDEVLGLQSDVLLGRFVFFGTNRVGGGAFERQFLQLRVFGGDGLLTRLEYFDADRVEEALARFDELTAEPQTVRRRVRPNAATANAAGLDAAIAAKDADALPGLFADSFAIEDHQTGVAYDRAGSLATWRGMLRIQELRYRQEPLATLDDSLALLRQSSSGVFGGKYDAGAFDREELVLLEVDAQGRRRRAEIFASDHLGDAIVRLYERYAELLPDGPARTRAAATARSVEAYLGRFGRWAAAFAPAIEVVDHRPLGIWSMRGAEALLQNFQSWIPLTHDAAIRQDEILGLQPDVFLGRRTFSGTDRASGGKFERQFIQLCVFGSDGLMTRLEYFETDGEAEALARFDELTAGPPRSARRFRPNAATANLARGEAAIAARDAGALPALFSDDYEALDHTTGTSWDRRGVLAGWRSLINARDPRSRHEPLATLGDSLTLYRSRTSASEFSLGDLDIGAFEREQMNVMEVDAQGRRCRWESFAAHRLGDAVARLYERYAELLPEGLARSRSVATARSVAALLGPFDLARYAPALAPAIEFIDHRFIGLESAQGADAYLRLLRALREITDDIATRVDDVVDLRSDALLVRWTNFGTERAGGGAYERQFLRLFVFGADGLLARSEFFDLDRESEALARLDALTAGPPRFERRVRPNAATANAARLEAAVAARNEAAFPALFAEDTETLSHLTGTQYGREGALITLRSVLKARDLSYRIEPLATLGSSLALCRQSMSASGVASETFDVGAYERQEIILWEVDSSGRRTHSEWFAADRLGDAIVRLYQRHADSLSDAPDRERSVATARSVAALSGPISDARWAEAIAPAIEVVDHRLLATFSASGAEALLQGVRSWLELGVDPTMAVDEVLRLEPNALLSRRTHSGTDRFSGGVYERELIQLLLFGADGRVTRFELFDVGHEATAVARFDELTAGPQPVRRRVPPNAATAHAAREDAAFAARDAGAFATLYADEVEVVDHLNGATLDQSEHLTSLRRLLRAQDLTRRHEALATLGDALALCRMSLSAGGFARGNFDVGAYEAEVVILFEVDARGRCRRCEQLASDHLSDAIVRLYERFAELLPDGPERTRAAATARSAAALLGPFDPDRYAAVYAPAIEVVDRRTLGTMTSRGAEAHRQNMRSWSLLSDSTANRFEEILDLRSGAFLGRQTFLGTDRAGGGVFERPFILLWVFGSDGLLSRLEYFDGDREAKALARFDELTAESPAPAARIENAATRSEDAAQRAWESNDWESLAALFSAHFRSIDRRPLMRLETDRDTLLAGIRPFVDARVERSAELLATRGERLALFRVRLRGSVGASGPSEVELLQVTEVDASGLRSAAVAFGPDELDAAYAELDERYASEAGPHASTIERMQRIPRAFVARDWEQLASMYADDYVMIDHRVLGWGTRSRDEALAQLRVMVDLAPDVMLRVDHFAINHRGTFNAVRWMGSREGGPFEIPFINVISLGPDGRIRRSHTYDLDQLDAARACFDALTAEPPALAAHIESAATRAVYGVSEAWASRDWKRLADGYVAGFRYSDRKRMTQMGELDRSQYLEFIRPLFEMSSSRLEHSVLATRGERLALARQRVDVADHNTGPSEIESVAVFEVDERGERVATIRFDAEDLDAAYAELDARFLAGEAAPHAQVWAGMQEFKRAFAERDWDALAARCAADLVVHDHRLLGWHSLHGPAAYLEALRSLVDLAPDTKLRIDHVTICEHGYLVITVWEGTREGGAYEDPSLMVAELDARGRIHRFDQYDLERLEEARARFAELHADPLRIPPNASTRAMDRAAECIERTDWDALADLFASTYVCEDRRRLMRNSVGREQIVASIRLSTSAGFRVTHTTLATAGERLALLRMCFRSFEGAALIAEVENLQIQEIDAEGRFVASIVLDPDDRRAASAELLARDPYPDAVKRALVDHDLDRLRAALPDDVVLNDYRRTGVGKLEGVDNFVAYMAVLFEQAPGAIMETLYTIAAEEHGNLAISRLFGTLVDGGQFERFVVRLASLRGGQIVGLELFEPEDLDAARARFEELRPDPLRIPPNAATRAMDRMGEYAETGNWDGLRELLAPGFVFEDRRRLVRDTGDRDKMIKSVRLASSSGARASHSLLATAGDRLALARLHFSVLEGSTLLAEIETLQVSEIDGEGRIVATITFDPEDRRAASLEMLDRYFRGEGARWIPRSSMEVVRAMNDHDLGRLRSALPDDFYLDDHRRTGVGRLGNADDYVASMSAVFEQSRDMTADTLYHVAVDERGSLSVGRMFGTLVDGGEFESIFIRLNVYQDGRSVGTELWELDDLDLARARFEALRP